jgi:hypothetical protein
MRYYFALTLGCRKELIKTNTNKKAAAVKGVLVAKCVHMAPMNTNEKPA